MWLKNQLYKKPAFRDPFKISPASDFSSNAKKLLSSVDEGSLQLELVDIQCSSSLKENFQESGTCKFWSESIQKERFPNAKKVAIYILTMFGPAYTCQSSFSGLPLSIIRFIFKQVHLIFGF